MLNGAQLHEQETLLDAEIVRLETQLIKALIDGKNEELTLKILTERQNIEHQFENTPKQFNI